MNILVSQEPERRIAIVSKNYALILKNVFDTQHEKNKKPLCAIELISKNDLQKQNFKKLTDSEIHGFIGLIEMDDLIFVAAITGKSKVAAPTPGETVNKIFAVDFFCLNDPTWDFYEIDSSGYPILPESDLNGSGTEFPNTMPRQPCFEIRKLLSNGSFYYSTDFDLTSTLQDRGFGSRSLSADNFEQEYMWNYFLMQEIVTYRDRLDTHAKQILDDEGFLTTVIRGFAETFITYVRKTKVALTIISKQSWKRAGTRFNARGVDDESNVANFVETEFIMYSTQYCYAFAEIRGSIPVFWEQDTSLINPKVQITRSLEATQPVFDKHFIKSIQKYGPIHVVNLLSTKTSELPLSRRYKEHLTKSRKLKIGKDVFYTAFDFHKETAQEGFSGANKLIPGIMDSLLTSGYFSYNVKENRVISEQLGVFRTNCLDCLDRTNLVQQVISLAAFKIFLQDFNLITSNTYIEEDDFVLKHNNLWADHGDQISQIYTGTNALKSSFSRKGKMSLAGALSDATKSVSRMYINNFMDKGKQQNIDALLGRLPHQQAVQLFDPINEYVSSQLEKMSDQYTSSSTINLLIGTYNVNGVTKKIDLSKWLFPIGDKFKPDVVVLGLQEVIELTAGSILNADYSKGSAWENMVNECLNQYESKYLLLRVEQMSSLLILFFVKADKAKSVKCVEGASKKTGFGGMAGNKGAVAIRFDFEETSFCFVNTHLSAGATNIDDRRNDYESIVKGINFTRSKNISHHDSTFWLGDTNYRIALSNEEVRRELAMKHEGYIDRLMRHDQLTQEIDNGFVFRGFKEPAIKFRPTYKYDSGTDNYDTSEKARTPSWTDRIIYKGDYLQPLVYSDAPLLMSDHRPVYSAYRSRVVSVNEDEKIKLTKQLYAEYKASHPEETRTLSSQLINLGLEDDRSLEITTTRDMDEFSLLDMNNNSGISTAGSSSSNLSSTTPPYPGTNSLSASFLNPKKVSTQTEARAKPLLRPPPPPAFDSNEFESSNSNKDQKSVEMETISKPSPPAVEMKPVINGNVKSKSSGTPPPPGFTEVILTPKNSNAAMSTPPISNAGSATFSNTDIPSKSSESPKSYEAAKKSSHIGNKTLSSWEPLTPK
ncbi:hypothetical protein KAFR_0J02020 [Kazachstania africana CBS 2517]|uniref:phosphoinositide 5-phosphatase n=1 Tax=Kazachstania africana (strain ATCC 22294 / BCRC 22015 / CBS 2517 / CECT 1963 / NBRC 1671 / NRRL Y-8276) TaxID=1071382 RepID=H2B0W6_KAZAF|nr:hypothetical protein KAFR_0J02020 [Kazachstania africana CBS 2517]CCF60266.1 hypothetical protein KAFR_0J02020 [Kazachstania africana CBS 2517]